MQWAPSTLPHAPRQLGQSPLSAHGLPFDVGLRCYTECKSMKNTLFCFFNNKNEIVKTQGSPAKRLHSQKHRKKDQSQRHSWWEQQSPSGAQSPSSSSNPPSLSSHKTANASRPLNIHCKLVQREAVHFKSRKNVYVQIHAQARIHPHVIQHIALKGTGPGEA